MDRRADAPVDLVVEDPEGLESGLLDRVTHGGQRRFGHGGRGRVVEADDRDVCWHPAPGRAQRPDRADGHQVRGDEQAAQPSIVSPFGVYLARVYAAVAVPEEIIEAGRIDGAGEGRIFRTVVLRIMSPALVTMFLFQFVAIWNNFFLPLVMLSNTRLYPVTLGLYTWNNQYGQAPQLISYVIIGSLISVIPLVIAFLSLQRFWRSGLAAGSVRL